MSWQMCVLYVYTYGCLDRTYALWYPNDPTQAASRRIWRGAGPGPYRSAIDRQSIGNSYSAQEGINSKGNTIDIYYRFPRNVKKIKNQLILQFYNAIRNAKSIRIQPNTSILIKKKMTKTVRLVRKSIYTGFRPFLLYIYIEREMLDL